MRAAIYKTQRAPRATHTRHVKKKKGSVLHFWARPTSPLLRLWAPARRPYLRVPLGASCRGRKPRSPESGSRLYIAAAKRSTSARAVDPQGGEQPSRRHVQPRSHAEFQLQTAASHACGTPARKRAPRADRGTDAAESSQRRLSRSRSLQDLVFLSL